MKKIKLPIYHKVPIISAIILACLCWTAALFQSLFSLNRFTEPQAIPAFQNEIKGNLEEFPSEESIPAFKTNQTIEYRTNEQNNVTRENVSDYVGTLCASLDADCRKISSHTEKNYTDFYYYSPILAEKYKIDSVTGSNLQIAFTWDKNGNLSHIYMGFPNIDYDF